RQTPDSLTARLALTPIIPTPAKDFAPRNVAPGYIYFVRDSGLWRIAPDGSGETKLMNLPVTNPPQPSPDGKLIAFTSESDLYVIPSEGGEAHKLASGQFAEHQRLGWSQGGSLIGYLVYNLNTSGISDAWAVSV